MRQSIQAAASKQVKHIPHRITAEYVKSLWFFYGSLMDPDVLQRILDLPERPLFQRGKLLGFKIKMWGIYPAAVPSSSDNRIEGMVYALESQEHLKRLEAYETTAYTWCNCTLEMEDGSVVKDGRTFCWAGDENSRELQEGEFDFIRFQTYFKSSVTQKPSAS